MGLLKSQLLSNGLDPSSGHLDDPRCSAHQERNGTVWYQVERRAGSCGTSLTVRAESLVCLPADLSVCLSVCLPTREPVCLSVCLHVCLSV